MKFQKLFLGFSLIEVLVVISIITILSFITLLSFSENKSQVVVNSFTELLHDQVISIQKDVLYKNLERAEMYFSLDTPRSYQLWEKKSFSNFQNQQLAQNISFKILEDASPSSVGTATISWDSPESGDLMQFIILGNNVEITRSNEVITEKTITPLSEYQKYTFHVENKKSLEFGEDLILQYFSKENIAAEELFPVLLKKIEGKNANNEWVDIHHVTLKISKNLGKMYILSDSNSFLNVRLTFEKQNYSTVYEIF